MQEINVKRTKTQTTVRLDKEILVYFKKMAGETGLSYQTLMNMCLMECVNHKKKPAFEFYVKDEDK